MRFYPLFGALEPEVVKFLGIARRDKLRLVTSSTVTFFTWAGDFSIIVVKSETNDSSFKIFKIYSLCVIINIFTSSCYAFH